MTDASFSERMGLKTRINIVQIDQMSTDLRIGIWNCMHLVLFRNHSFLITHLDNIIYLFYLNILVLPVSDRPEGVEDQLGAIQNFILKAKWHEVYDFLEWFLNSQWSHATLIAGINRTFERFLSGYRFVQGKIVPNTSVEEIESINNAIEQNAFSGASIHLKQALVHLSNKENPDFRNSIKESISAIESIARSITGKAKASLPDVLNELEKTIPLHPALREAINKLYGYTSDEGGLRHALINPSKVDVSDAMFFLVVCSAFVNYLITRLSPAE